MDATGGTDGIKKFIAAYKTEYGHDPENAFAALGYDTVYLLVDAIKRAGNTDSAAVKTAIEGDQGLQGHHRRDHVLGRLARAPEGRHGDRGEGRQVHARRRGRPGKGAGSVAATPSLLARPARLSAAPIHPGSSVEADP